MRVVYDPAWDMPQPNWQQQGSFESGEIPPAVSPDAGTPICIGPVAQEWLPVMLGALDQLRNPSSWIVADDDAMYQVLQRVDRLREIVAISACGCAGEMTRFQGCVLQTSVDGGVTWSDVPGWVANFGGCVRDNIPIPPPNPGPDPPAQRACNIAGFFATYIISQALAKAVAEYGSTVKYIDFADWVAQHSFAVALPYATFFAESVFQAWKTITAGNIADFNAAVSDPVLLSLVTCAIFGAIYVDGAITDGNYAAVVAAVCAISYIPASVIPTICNLFTGLGAVNARAIQVTGAYEAFDCSGCQIVWCGKIDFTTTDGGFTRFYPLTSAGVYHAGIGWVGEIDASGKQGIDIKWDLPAATGLQNITVEYISPDAKGAGFREFAVNYHGVTLFAGTLGTLAYPAGEIAGRNFSDRMDQLEIAFRNSGVNTGPVIIKSITMTGNSPLGSFLGEPAGLTACTYAIRNGNDG